MFVSRRITKELDTGCWKQEGITLILDTCAHRVSNSTKIYSSTCVHALTSLFLSLSSLCDSPSLFRELSPTTLRDKLSLSLSPLSSVRDQREDGHRDRTSANVLSHLPRCIFLVLFFSTSTTLSIRQPRSPPKVCFFQFLPIHLCNYPKPPVGASQ